MSTLNTSDVIGSLQSQIISLHSQPLQKATLNSINMFDGTKKAEFATWALSIENATRICSLDAINIALSKLQGAPLKSAIYLEGKETSSGKKLSWTTLKQHLTTNYSKIPYSTHAINAYETLQQGADKSTKANLHRVQDILEHIHHTNNMSSITGIGTNHTKILTGLKDKKLHNKLGESTAKKWTNMAQVLHDVAEMAVSFERSRGYSLPSFEVNHSTAISLKVTTITDSASCLQKIHSNPNQNLKRSSVDNARETTSRRIAPLSSTKVIQNILDCKIIKKSKVSCLSNLRKDSWMEKKVSMR